MENPAFSPDQNESEFIVDNEETDVLRELEGVQLVSCILIYSQQTQ